MTEPKPRNARGKGAFTLEAAREQILDKLAKAGAKGASSPVTAKTPEPKRLLYSQALEEMESEGAIYVARAKAKPKYFSIEFKPTASSAAAKMEQLAARRHPALLSAVDLKKALVANEKVLAIEAIVLLENDGRLVKLTRGKAVLFAHGDSLRAVLGISSRADGPTESNPGETIREAYENLVRLTGFPDVEIASLQRQSGVPMAAVKEWLLAEHQNGRADFGTGDWSLAKDDTRAGLIDLRGERYLYVRLRVSP